MVEPGEYEEDAQKTLAEASAWVRTYNEALASPQVRAVIAEPGNNTTRLGTHDAGLDKAAQLFAGLSVL